MSEQLTEARAIDGEQAVRAVLAAFFNVGSGPATGNGDPEWSIRDFLLEVSPRAAPGYLDEKAALWRSSPVALVGAFDPDRFRAFVAWAIRRFGEEGD